MIRVCLSGAGGRMGRQLTELLLAADDLQLAAALEHPDHPDLGRELAPGVALGAGPDTALSGCDVLLDFALPAAVAAHAGPAADRGLALVSGTTGLDDRQQAALRAAAERVAVVHGSNMSRGVHLLGELVRRAAAALGPEYDVEILEAHHRHKADLPSGTAWQLARSVEQVRGGAVVTDRAGRRQPGQIGISALRGGDVVGEHQIHWLGGGEQLVLTHRATSREHFCRGALDAVRFACGRAAGLYTMADVFGAGG